ncbi:MAG: hypothetical protein ACI4QT_05675 [Kiritimatiellia bacterium]
MKLPVALLQALFVSAALAVDVETLNGPNLLGVVRVTSSSEYLPLAVSWGAVGYRDADPAADALVLTSGLEPGDSLYVYDRANSQYRVFDLVRNDTGDAWQARNVIHISGGQAEVVSGEAADATTLAIGYGAWLHRPGVASRSNQTVLVVGQVQQSGVTVELAAAPSGKSFGQTLFGLPIPASGNFKLNGGSIDWVAAGTVAGDEIRVPQADGSQETIRFDGTKWVRKYFVVVNGVNRIKTDTNPEIVAGTAVWYARKAGNGPISIPLEAQ